MSASLRCLWTAASASRAPRFLPTPIRRHASSQIPASEQPAASPDTKSQPSPKTAEQAPEMTSEERAVLQKLSKAFEGGQVAVQDVSGGCGSFFAIQIAHPSFKGQSVVKQHQRVNKELTDELKRWHGVQVRFSAHRRSLRQLKTTVA